MLATTIEIHGTLKKIYMKYKKMLNKKGSKNSDGNNTSEKSKQANLLKNQMRIHVIS